MLIKLFARATNFSATIAAIALTKGIFHECGVGENFLKLMVCDYKDCDILAALPAFGRQLFYL